MSLNRAGLLLAVAGAALCCACGCAGSGDGAVMDVADFEQPDADVGGYRLGHGDEVQIMFPAERSLDYVAPISPAGTISVPSGGEVVAAGKTVAELGFDIEAAMASMLLDPQTSVVLKTVAERPVYVLGEVSRPGAVNRPAGLRLSMALADAGGLLSTGKPSSVMIVRTTGVPEAVAIKADVTKVLSGRDLAQDLELQPYDVVYVPKSVIGKVDEFVELFFTRIAPAQLFYLRGYDIAERGGLRFYQ